MIRITRILLVICSIATLSTYANSNQFFSKADVFFKQYVKSGLVNYQGIKNSPQQLNQLVQLMAEVKTDKLDKNTFLAFYINAYNVAVIKNVITHYPLKSPLDVKGFFKETKFKIGGKEVTLDQIENQIIRPKYKDARVHFALVCGAKGCPPLISQAYTPSNVQSLLTRQTKLALDNPSFTKVKGNSVQLTEIFNWYKQDFGNSNNEIIEFINKFKTNKLKPNTSISHYTYNWELNKI